MKKNIKKLQDILIIHGINNFQKGYKKYEKTKYISGEYLTYTCIDKEKMLIKK